MKQIWKKHPFLFFFSVFSLLCVLLLLLCRLFPSFAEGMARGPASMVRYLLAAITAPLPFSLFELLIFSAALYGAFLLGLALFLLIRSLRRKVLPRFAGRCYLAAILVLVMVFDLFILTFAPSYFRYPTAQHMGLDTQAVDEEQVFYALEQLSQVVNEAAPSLKLNEAGESLQGASLDEIKAQVVDAADAFGTKHAFYQKGGFPAKNFLCSPVMTYTHLSGVYGFFTGEANINTNYPHFIVTATLAHETSHARGIAPENECNFLAAVILLESPEPYLRYCAAAFIMDDLVSVCNRLDRERTSAILAETDPVLQRDWAAYSRFFDKYRENRAAKVADTTNSTYLKVMGQEDGTVSYSRIIRLTAAYFQQESLEK